MTKTSKTTKPLNLLNKNDDPLEGLTDAMDSIVDELAMHTELLASIAYKQDAITAERYKEIMDDSPLKK